MAARLTPSSQHAHERDGAAAVGQWTSVGEQSRLIGALTHQVLRGWDFVQDPKGFEARAKSICAWGIPDESAKDAGEITNQVLQILYAFAGSHPYQDLCRAEILGREIPFAIPWAVSTSPPSPLPSPARARVMEGVIDLVYRLDGLIWVADYKTDRVRADELARRVALYGPQGQVYAQAVARCIGLENVGCKLIFLRLGKAVEIST